MRSRPGFAGIRGTPAPGIRLLQPTPLSAAPATRRVAAWEEAVSVGHGDQVTPCDTYGSFSVYSLLDGILGSWLLNVLL